MKTILLFCAVLPTSCHMTDSPAAIFAPPGNTPAAPAVPPAAATRFPINPGAIASIPGNTPTAPAVPPAAATLVPQNSGSVATIPGNAPAAPAIPPTAVTATPQNTGTVITPTIPSVAASLTFVMGGSTMTFTAVKPGAEGNSIVVKTLAAGANATPVVTVSGNLITYQICAKNLLSFTGTTPALPPAYNVGNSINYSLPQWQGTGLTVSSIVRFTGTKYVISGTDEDGYEVYHAEKTSVAGAPDGLTGWTVTVGSGQPVITATADTTAPEIVTALGGYMNGVGSAAGLITAVASGNGTSTIGTAGSTLGTLSGGTGLASPAAISP